MVLTAAPNNAFIAYTDHSGVVVDASRAVFTRPISYLDVENFRSCAPASRVRFRYTGQNVTINVTYTALMLRVDTWNPIGTILVDGVFHSTFTTTGAQSAVTDVSIPLTFSSGTRLVEVIMPHGASVDFRGLTFGTDATLLTVPARAATTIAVYGDSITHGYFATDSAHGWPYLMGRQYDAEVINLGYGGRVISTGDGTAVAGVGADAVTVMCAYNSFSAQTAVATWKQTLVNFIAEVRAVQPTVPIYAMTMTWTGTILPIRADAYRNAVMEVVRDAGDANLYLVDASRFGGACGHFYPDKIHPNDTAQVGIASSLGAIVIGGGG